MSISKKQQYHIQKAKEIKADSIIENITNNMGESVSINRKIIMGMMNKELRASFQIDRIQDLPVERLNEYLYAIFKYNFTYDEKHGK